MKNLFNNKKITYAIAGIIALALIIIAGMAGVNAYNKHMHEQAMKNYTTTYKASKKALENYHKVVNNTSYHSDFNDTYTTAMKIPAKELEDSKLAFSKAQVKQFKKDLISVDEFKNSK